MTRRVTLNGLDLFDDTGAVAWILGDVDGLGSAPSRFASGEKSGTDGSWAAKSMRAARPYSLTGATVADDPYLSEVAIDRLMLAVRGDEVPLTFHYATGPRTALVRLDGTVKVDRVTPDAFRWQIPLLATDPNLYLGDGVTPGWSGTTARASTVGGLTFPFTFPFSWGSTIVGGLLHYRNPGSAGKLTMRLDGPLVDPTITVTNADGTRTLAWVGTFPDTTFVTVDPASRTALLQGQASRPPARRGWPRLTPGDNTFQFHAGGSSTGTLTVYAWPAY